MLPHLPPTVQVKKENRELVLDIAENIFPGAYAISDLKKGEREKWIILSCDILRENKADISASIEAIAKVLDPAVQAEIEDTLLKRNFFFEQEEKRSEIEGEERQERREREKATHAENLLDQAQARRLVDERWDLEKKERNKRLAMEVNKHKNSSLRERIGIGMAVIGFLVAFVLLCIGLKSGQGYVAGSSGAVAVTILGVVLRLLFLEQKQSPPPPLMPPPSDATSAASD